MPKRDFSTYTNESTTPRRSPRLLLLKSTSEPQTPTTPRKAEDFKSFDSKSRRKVVSSNPSPNSVEIVSLPQGHRDSTKKSSKKSKKSNSNSRNCITCRAGLRRSSRLNNEVDGFRCLRRSSRLSNQKVVVHEHKDFPRQSTKKSNKPDNCFGDFENVTPGSRKSTRLNNRSRLTEKKVSFEPCRKVNRAKSLERIDSDSNTSVEEAYQVVACKPKVEDNSIEKSSGKGEKMTSNVSITHEELIIEGREGKARNQDRSKDNEIKRKRKRGENGEASMKGWTKEQEVALQRAYFAAKPTPHFWKKVSKLVPGKSAQDCFERIHRDHSTPPQVQPRSRAKIIKSSSLDQFSLSASMLLKSKKTRRSSCLNSKNYLTQKSLKKLLQCRCKADQDHEGDLFSVLEPDMDLSTNALQPSDAVTTPKQLKETQGLLQSCTETSSSIYKKSLSRFSSSCNTDLVSPPVLKQVKNRVLHEKYINQLLSREARRRAASARVKMSQTGKAVGEECSVQKRGVVESAKIALVSEARDAISKFQHSQANFMSICSSDEDIDDGVGVESADNEDESQ